MNISFFLKPITFLNRGTPDEKILKKLFSLRYNSQYKDINTDILRMHHSKIAPWVIKELLSSNLFEVENP